MLATWDSLKHSKAIDLKARCKKPAAAFKIEPGSKYEEMVCELLEHGNSIRITGAIVRGQMRIDGVPTFSSTSPIYTVIRRLNPIKNKYKKRNQATNSAAWVKARFNWCLHLLVRMNMVDDDLAKIISTLSLLPLWLDRDALIQGGYLFDIHQVVHFDEVHIKQKYGGLGAFQMRFKRESGEVVKNESDTYKSIIESNNDRGNYGPEHF